MRKGSFLVMSLLSMSLMFFNASCSSSSDSGDSDKPGTETPGGGSGETPGGGSETTVLGPVEAKHSLENTAQELLGKINVNELEDFKTMIDGVEYDEDEALSKWFEACGEASTVSESETGVKYLIVASNFVGEFTLQNKVWKQTKKGGDHLAYIFNDAKGNQCVLTLKASNEGTEIHHKIMDDEWDYWDGYKWIEGKDEYRLVLPKKMELTLTQNSVVKASTIIETQVKTNGEVDLTKDEVELTTKATIGAYQINVTKAAFNAGKNAEAHASISKNDETLITVDAKVQGAVDNELNNIEVGKSQLTVDVLDKAKFEAVIDDGSMFAENLKKAWNDDMNESMVKQYVENANKLLHAKLYLNNSKQSCATTYLAAVEDGYGSYKYWDAELWIQFADDSKYSYSDFFNETKFKSVIDKVQNIVDDFIKMFDN